MTDGRSGGLPLPNCPGGLPWALPLPVLAAEAAAGEQAELVAAAD